MAILLCFNVVARHVSFCIEMDYKHIYKLFMNIVCKLAVTNAATVRVIEAVSDKFNFDGICVRYFFKTVIIIITP